MRERRRRRIYRLDPHNREGARNGVSRVRNLREFPLTRPDRRPVAVRPLAQMAKPEPVLPDSVLRSISEVLGQTHGGLTNVEIDRLLAEAGVNDPTPRGTQFTYVVVSKRDRLHRALSESQTRAGRSNRVLRFIKLALAPVRFHDAPGQFEALRTEVNVPLAFVSLRIEADGTLVRVEKATTLTEARRRAMRLRSQLVDRNAHPRLLEYCVEEIDDDNYFHAVLEASKSLADEIRRRTGRTEDGVPLINSVFEPGQRGSLLLVLTSMRTETERSRQRGLGDSLRGVFASLRNPTAHDPKIRSNLTEQDALDELGHMSYLHRRIDECQDASALAVVA